MKESDPRKDSPTPRRRDLVDETSDESFPASDPPGWSLLHVGAPRKETDEDDSQDKRRERQDRKQPRGDAPA